MGRRGVALNTSLIHINNMSAYYNSNQINIYNSLDITGNTSISHNLTISGTDEINHNYDIKTNEIIYSFDVITNNRLTINDNEITTLNLYVGNTYIFDQSSKANVNSPNELIIISTRKLRYDRTSYNIVREPHTVGVSYIHASTGNTYQNTDADNRIKLRFVPSQRGTYYLVSKIKTQIIKTVTINVLDNVYKYGTFITNAGMGLDKNLNVAGNMNVKDGMLYVVNDPQYTKPKSVGIGTTVPRLGLDMINLPNYNDAVILPRTIGLGTHTGIEGMVRMNGELSVAEGYLEDEWIALGLVQDKDKDTFIDPEISVEREDEMEFTTNGHKRLTILSDDITKIGIGTLLPKSTLEINGNLNVTSDTGSSGIDFCKDTTHTDNYLHVILTNTQDKLDKSLDFTTNNGGFLKEITNNVIESINSKTSILNNNTLDLTGDYNFTNADNSSIQINKNTSYTTTKKYNKTIENTSIETHQSNNTINIHNNSLETFSSSFNINIDDNQVHNVYKTKYLHVIDNTNETFSAKYNINLKSNLTETISGTQDFTIKDFNFETYKKNYNHDIFLTKTSTIKNNFNTLINTTYNINVKGNTTETYLSDFNKTTSLYQVLDIYGSNILLTNNNVSSYKNNVNINNNGFLERKITINKNNNIFGNFDETYKKNVINHSNTDNISTIYGNFMFNLTNSYYNNINANKNITIENNLNLITRKETRHFFTGSTTNNIFCNSTFHKDFTHNINRISNLIVYNENDKYINLDSTEVFKKNKFNYLWLSGHPLSGHNTISYEIPNIFLTNYIKIVQLAAYNTNVANNATYYTFPGFGNVNNANNTVQVNDWFIFIPGQVIGTYSIINSYNSNINIDNINTNEEYYILGPNDENNFAVIHKNNYNPNVNYIYDKKFIMGPRKHQLGYNLSTHYIKIFNIGNINNNVSIFKLVTNSITIQQHTSTFISDVGVVNENENSRFIFIYLENTKEVGIHGIITKAQYYIYSKSEDYTNEDTKPDELVGYLCNTNSSLDVKKIKDNSCIWTIEAINPNDASYNVDMYYIYNTTNSINYYLEFHNNNTGVFLNTTNSNTNIYQHFTLYYYYKHFTNITSSLLTYNEETRGHYLTKDYKYLYINNNTSSYISSELDANNKNKIGTGPNDPFLLIYNNTITIPGSGIDTGTFKIFNVNTQQYLYNNKELNWVIESIEESNNSHADAIYTIKGYNNGNPTHFLYNNNGILDLTPIVYPITSTPRISIINTTTNIQPGTYNKKVYKPFNRSVATTEDIMITGNINETYKARFNSNVGSNLEHSIKNLYNINVYQNNNHTFSKFSKKTILNNVSESIFKEHKKHISNNYTAFYNTSTTSYISGSLTEKITGYVDKKIYDTQNTFVLANNDETYKNNYTTKSSHNIKTIKNNLVETIGGTNHIYVDKSIKIVNNSSKTLDIIGNINSIIGLDNNINITKNVNTVIGGNKNITIPLDLILSISGIKETSISKSNDQLTNKDANISYHKNKTNITLNNVNTIVSGDYKFTLDNNNKETYQSDKTVLIDNNFTETISGYMNINVTKDTTFNDASDFNLSCNENINLISNGYVHIVNDNTNDGFPNPSNKKALVVYGGTHIKKNVYVDGDILISNILNVLGEDSSLLKTEDFEVNDPLIMIGMLQEDDSTYSGILSQTFINSESKFAGIVRNNLNTYAILNNINTDTIDTDEYSSIDMNNTYSQLYVNKHSNFTANKIVSLQPNINTHGDMYIAKNIFLGIVDTPQANVENSFTVNIGSNINASQDILSITSNKDVIYNITNSQNINITSNNNYNIDVLNNRHTHIHNNLVETIQSTFDKYIKDTSTEVYKKNYNLNIGGDFTKTIKNNNTKTIKYDYNINHTNATHQTVKHDYNLNILQNSINRFNSNVDFYSNNLIKTIYSDYHSIIDKNKTLDVHENCKYNITGTNKLYIKQDNNEIYHNTNINIHNNLTETVTGLHNKIIYGTRDTDITNLCKETYGNNKTIHTTGTVDTTITGNNNRTINNTLNRTINNNVTETYKKNNTITISENLNSIITGTYNINVSNDVLTTFNKNNTNIIHNNITSTNKSTYDITVYDNNQETYYGHNCNIDQKYDKIIKYRYFNVINGNSKITIKENNIHNNNKYRYTNVHNNSIETYGNTYDKHFDDTILVTHRHNKNFNIYNHYKYNSNNYYSQRTIGISTSTFRTNYNLNLDGHLKETYYSDITSYIKVDNYEKTKNNYDAFTNTDKTHTINTNLYETVKGFKKTHIDDVNTKTAKLNNDVYITGNYTTTDNKYVHNFIKNSDKIVYNNTYTRYIGDNVTETYDKTLTTIHHTGAVNNSVKNTILYNNSVCTKINNDYTKNVYMNYDQSIAVNLNNTIVGDIIVTYNKTFDVTTHNNKTKNINNNFIETIFNITNETYKKNKSITISHNNTFVVTGNYNSTLHNSLYETYNSSKFVKKGSDNTTLLNYTNQGTVYNEIKQTFRHNIKNDDLETYKDSSTTTITKNKNKLVNGTYNINIVNSSTEIFKKSYDITQANNTSIFDNIYSKYIEKDTTETYKKPSTIITNNINTKYIGGTYNLTSNHVSKPNINITTAGNLNITADANINKNNNINFITRVGIKDIVSYTPQIINTSTIGSNNISEFINSTSAYVLNPKTVNIIYVDAHADLTSLINNDKNIYLRLNLPEASYNGQIVKIIVHPIFEQTFDINDRLSKGLNTNIVIRINSFCDTNDNEYVTVDLLLNRGGMGLSLIYVDNNNQLHDDAYWMLMNNNYIYN